MITLWSYSIPGIFLTDFKVQTRKIFFKRATQSNLVWFI
jgi:hypothetical protein